MKNVASLLLIGAMGVSLFSCSDDKKDDVKPNNTTLLTAKSWRVSASTISGVDILPLMDPCDKDDLIKFNADKTATYDAGATKCDPMDPQTQNGSWDFLSNETRLKLTDPDGDVIDAQIVTLSATTLKISASIDPGTGTMVPAELTFTAQ